MDWTCHLSKKTFWMMEEEEKDPTEQMPWKMSDRREEWAVLKGGTRGQHA